MLTSTSLGRYRLEERIAQGGMGEVYRATDIGHLDDSGIQRTVAVKRIAPQYAREPEFLKTFKNEARLSFLLGHANVVRVLDVGDADGEVYLVLEWVHGADLSALIAQLRREAGQTMPTRLALTIAAEVARGLDYAHRLVGPEGEPLGLVHRDVSPSNILLSVEGEVKVTDFGIARSRLPQSASLPGQLKGKLFYMAPEQANGEPLDRRADVFALGAVLYEMLTGENPFLATGSDADLLDRVRRGDFPPPTHFVKTLDQSINALVMKAMAPRRQERFASCRELRDALIELAVQNGYALSQDELGDFVRTLCERHGAALQPTSPPTVPGRKTTAPVRVPTTTSAPHDAVTTASVTAVSVTTDDALNSDETVPDSNSELDADIVVTARHRRPAPLPADEQHAAASGEPSATSRRGLVGAGLSLIVISFVGLLGAKLLRLGDEHPRNAATGGAATTPNEAPPPKAPDEVAPLGAAAPMPVPTGKALLTVESDQPAEIYLDGALVGTAPLIDHVVLPGAHRIKLHATGRGLFVVPGETSLQLKAGERRRLFVPFKEWKSGTRE